MKGVEARKGGALTLPVGVKKAFSMQQAFAVGFEG